MKNLLLVLLGMVFLLAFSACSQKVEKYYGEGENSRKSILEMDISEIIIPEEDRQMYDIDQRMEIFRAWVHYDPKYIDGTQMLSDSLKYIALVSPNLLIEDVFTGEEVVNVYDKSDTSDMRKFAMNKIVSAGRNSCLLLYNNGIFTVFNVDDLPRALKELSSYFARNKELDKRFFPLCVQEITKMYVYNRIRYSDHGPWRHWWGDEADSLGLIYNKLLNYR